ncbi:hypothetical protein GPEL0_01r1949 [Geoanaerobacter pelophilus]|uniref:Uncharacterized protein n=1 Tax=Geoanaerobacter pelophilus TaxID=60036 RepID=A0ABQ0MHH3_9BACT|nr:hypothetical protein GPEL0_01r1949 [Geoanaerobacter pelophilus]
MFFNVVFANFPSRPTKHYSTGEAADGKRREKREGWGKRQSL